jgi:type IV pilus assembly protein PilM
MNPLTDILKKVKTFFTKSTKATGSVIGIDIGSSSVKLVQLKTKKEKAVLETYGAIALGPYVDPEKNNGEVGSLGEVTNLNAKEIAQAVADLMKEASVTTSDGTLAIPSSVSLVFMLELPASVPKKDFASVIPTEARRYIPVPMTEVSIDWWVIPERVYDDKTDDSLSSTKDVKRTTKPTRVLVAAIHNDALQKYREIIKELNLTAESFEIEMFSAVRACVGQDLRPTAVLDMGASKTKLSIVERGIIHDFHIVNKGSKDITSAIATTTNMTFQEAEKLKKEKGMEAVYPGNDVKKIMTSTLDFIISDINDVLLGYEKKYEHNIERIILTGGGALLKGLVPYAEEKLNYKITLSDPFARTESPVFLSDALKKVGPEFSVAVGLALRQLQ